MFAALLVLNSGLTGSHLCPRSLDCARAGRHFCRPGSSHCGPCLRPLVENSRGRCIVRRRPASHSLSVQADKGKMNSYPELDEEIDLLSAVISEQRIETKLPAPPSQEVSGPVVMEPTASGTTHRVPTTKKPSNSSASFISTVATTASTNHTSALLSPVIQPYPYNDSVFIVMSSVFIVAGSVVLMIAGACWVRLQKGVRLTQKVDYTPYGLMRPQNLDNLPEDKKLAQNAQMYHYQYQKQQMLSLEKQRKGPKVPDSGASTDEENEDGDFTVYECPGLAPTGEMEVKNPLFDDSTLYFQKFHK